jgi:glutamyl-tRNA synthetase
MKQMIRLRFAPSPTGMMHLGNIRTALMNRLFSKQKHGTFILRIEDTDSARNFDPQAKEIIEDLHWLGLFYDEGPEVGGPYGPYFQSQRTDLYQEALNGLLAKNLLYRCFCTPEELEKRRTRQIALKKPPRYDRSCLMLNQKEIEELLNKKTTFIWRYKLDQEKSVTINDLSHGTITFELKNFSDFPLTRGDGSFTFIFANFVDDMLMKITHVIRGEDHLTNTACQAALFEAFNATLPTFWHLPMICNVEGKKLSKRDFGFSLRDLKIAGFLPEALLNYLSIIGGGSFKEEVMSFDELVQALNFDHISTTGQVKFDPEKMRWMNNKWIARISADELLARSMPYLIEAYPQIKNISQEQLSHMLQLLKTDLSTLKDVVPAIRFYFEQPVLNRGLLSHFEDTPKLSAILSELLNQATDSQSFVDFAKKLAKGHEVKIKELFGFIRIGLMGTMQGPSIHDLIEILGINESKKRLMNLISF